MYENKSTISPLAKSFLCLVVVGVNGFGWNAKSTENLDREVSKISMSTKHRSHRDQQRRVDGRHDDQRANAIRPRTVAKAAFDSKYFTDGRSYQLK